MGDEVIRWYIADRGRGKTSDLITWVKLGTPTAQYPFWTRIILEPTMQMANQLRGGEPATNKYGLDYHQVYHLGEWQRAYRGRTFRKVEIGVDNVDIFLQLFLGVEGKITRATATGDATRWPELVAMEDIEGL